MYDVKESWVALLLAWMFEAAGAELLRPHFNISWKNPEFSQSRTHLLKFRITRHKLCLNVYCPIPWSLAMYS